jgi:hypothetical protein
MMLYPPLAGVDPAAGDRFIHRTPISLLQYMLPEARSLLKALSTSTLTAMWWSIPPSSDGRQPQLWAAAHRGQG